MEDPYQDEVPESVALAKLLKAYDLSLTRPLQDIRLFIRGVCSSQYYSWRSTPSLLHPPAVVFCNQYCAICDFSSGLPVLLFNIQH